LKKLFDYSQFIESLIDQNVPDPVDQVFSNFYIRFVFIHPLNQLVES